MLQLLITRIKWDTDGESLEECRLPTTVIMLDVPADLDEETIEEGISEWLSDAFGFCHDGFAWERLSAIIRWGKMGTKS